MGMVESRSVCLEESQRTLISGRDFGVPEMCTTVQMDGGCNK